MSATQGMTDDYDAHSEYQRAVAGSGASRITACVEAVTIPAEQPFVLADLGCATGANSMASMSTAIDAIRLRESRQPVVAVHNDVYARTVDEARAPVARGDVPFTEIECRTDPVANPYFTKWQSDGDAAAYATAYAAFARGFTESSLRDHLFQAAPDPDRAIDEFFARLTRRFRADPARDPFEDWTLTVVLARG